MQYLIQPGQYETAAGMYTRHHVTREGIQRPKLHRAMIDHPEENDVYIPRQPRRAMTAKPTNWDNYNHESMRVQFNKPIFTYTNVAEIMSPSCSGSTQEEEEDFEQSNEEEEFVSESPEPPPEHHVKKDTAPTVVVVQREMKPALKSVKKHEPQVVDGYELKQQQITDPPDKITPVSSAASTSAKRKRTESIVFMINGQKCYPGKEEEKDEEEEKHEKEEVEEDIAEEESTTNKNEKDEEVFTTKESEAITQKDEKELDKENITEKELDTSFDKKEKEVKKENIKEKGLQTSTNQKEKEVEKENITEKENENGDDPHKLTHTKEKEEQKPKEEDKGVNNDINQTHTGKGINAVKNLTFASSSGRNSVDDSSSDERLKALKKKVLNRRRFKKPSAYNEQRLGSRRSKSRNIITPNDEFSKRESLSRQIQRVNAIAALEAKPEELLIDFGTRETPAVENQKSHGLDYVGMSNVKPVQQTASNDIESILQKFQITPLKLEEILSRQHEIAPEVNWRVKPEVDIRITNNDVTITGHHRSTNAPNLLQKISHQNQETSETSTSPPSLLNEKIQENLKSLSLTPSAHDLRHHNNLQSFLNKPILEKRTYKKVQPTKLQPKVPVARSTEDKRTKLQVNPSIVAAKPAVDLEKNKCASDQPVPSVNKSTKHDQAKTDLITKPIVDKLKSEESVSERTRKEESVPVNENKHDSTENRVLNQDEHQTVKRNTMQTEERVSERGRKDPESTTISRKKSHSSENNKLNQNENLTAETSLRKQSSDKTIQVEIHASFNKETENKELSSREDQPKNTSPLKTPLDEDTKTETSINRKKDKNDSKSDNTKEDNRQEQFKIEREQHISEKLDEKANVESTVKIPQTDDTVSDSQPGTTINIKQQSSEQVSAFEEVSDSKEIPVSKENYVSKEDSVSKEISFSKEDSVSKKVSASKEVGHDNGKTTLQVLKNEGTNTTSECSITCEEKNEDSKSSEKREEPQQYEKNDDKVSEKSALVRTTNRLLRQQNETEKQLQDLRQLLKVELDEQDESCERDERTQDRIDELEKQINSMDNKLERINLEITESRVNSQNMMSLDSGTPGTPLFIIDTPHRNSHEISKFAIPYEEEDENRDYYGGVDDDEQTSAYDTLDHVESVLEETKMQQEDLKNELQTQMMNMRAELEKQLAMQMTVTTTNETNVNDEEMDARVTYLEKQIEDMQKKIKVADEVIADTEVKKQKIQRKKKASAHKKAAKTLSKSSENSKSAKESIRNATSPAHKRLISKTSSKVSPAPNRKTSTNVASSLRTSTHDRKSHKSSETHGSIKTSTNKSSHKSEIHQSPASSASTSEKQQTLSVSTTAKTKSKPSQSTHVTLESRKSSKRTESTAKSKSHKTLSRASSKKIQSVSTLSHAKEMEKSSTSGESSGKESKLILNDCDEDQAEEMASQILDDMSTFEEVQLETVEGDGEPEETAAAKAMRDFKAFFNFNFKPFEKFKRKKRRKSVLHGLGTNWCVCPNAMWKYLGDEQDEEIVTRRKCISLILGIILIILLLAIVGSLAIGLSGSEPPEKPTESPLQFTVINADEEG